MRYIIILFCLAFVSPPTCIARRLGEHSRAHHHGQSHAKQTGGGGSDPDEETVHKPLADGEEPKVKQSTSRTHAKHEQQHYQQDGNQQYSIVGSTEHEHHDGKGKHLMDCGTFLVRQTDAIVMYDDYREIDPTKNHDDVDDSLLCTEGKTKNNKEVCFGGDEGSAIFVQGRCIRGRGSTRISFVGMDAGAELVFACEADPRANPSIECQCNQDDHPAGGCDIPFRAEARFGFVTIPEASGVNCKLICTMPTTNE